MPRQRSYATIRSNNKDRALAPCTCGHRHNEHENKVGKDAQGRPTLDIGDAECAWMGCLCEAFSEAPPEREPRAPRVKTLDRDEPKLFAI